MLGRGFLRLSKCASTMRQMSKLSASSRLSKSLLQKYLALPIPGGTTVVDYIWIDGSGGNLRCRTRMLDRAPKCVEGVPKWHVDGTKMTPKFTSEETDIRLMPVAMYNDPMRRGGAKLVLCETYSMDYEPLPSNTRTACCAAFADTKDHSPLFGFCQQYMLMQVDGTPLGWPGGGAETPTTNACYCGVGARNCIGREIVEAHARACLYAGVGVAGFHAEQLASKWKFEIRPTAGIKAPDDVVIGRYLLQRIAAEFGVDVSFHPKLLPKRDGSGLHVQFSTTFMSESNGLMQIAAAAEALAEKHKAHRRIYDPKQQLGGAYETFTWGAGDRHYSVRIPSDVAKFGCGYLEDRRPAANCDPYAVCTAILRTTLCSPD